jgi:hypothetical protein
MKTQLPSLITCSPDAGIILAALLAEQLYARHEQARKSAERPGGTNYLLPPNVSVDIIGGILFYAIAAANHGWLDAN